MRPAFRLGRTALIVGVSISVAACANLRLYSETRDKQGQAVVKAWSEVNLKAYFDAERENRARLLEQDLATAARLNEVNRETEIRVLARKPFGELAAHYDEPLSALVLDHSAPIKDDERKQFERLLQTARAQLANQRATLALLERNLSFLEELGVPRFACEQHLAADRADIVAWAARNAEIAAAAKIRLAEAGVQCKTLATATAEYRKAVNGFQGGEIRVLAKGLIDAERRLKDKTDAAAVAHRRYVTALDAYEDEVASQKAGKSTVERTKTLADAAGSALSALESIGSFTSDKLVSEERIKRINALLESLKAGTELDADGASKAEIAASLLPALADDIRAVARAGRGRGAVPLLIKRDIEQARLNAANFVLAVERQQIGLRHATLEASIAEAASYVRARNALAKVKADSGKTVFVVWKDLTAEDKFVTLESMTVYLDAFSRQRTAGDALRIRRMALAQEESIGLAEVNASMWTSLIGATVSQASEFSALGLKASDFEKILNILGIFWIGHGVNK